MTQVLPKHIAIVMDGNGRWALKQGLLRAEGHRAGIDSVRAMVQACLKKQIPYLSLFAFSSENWARPVEEVQLLMQLFWQTLEQEIADLKANGVRLRFLGDIEAFSPELCQSMRSAEQSSAANQQLNLNIAVNYSGRWDILQALRQAMASANTELDETSFSQYLSTAGQPEPDLLIRTSGEQRISNFFLWQSAYTEFFFSDYYWPDFKEQALDEALAAYARRERRYGQTSQQLAAADV